MTAARQALRAPLLAAWTAVGMASPSLMPPAWAGTEVHIGVAGDRGEGSRWTIGMPPFLAERPNHTEDLRLGTQIREVVKDDLLFTGRFKAVEPPSAQAVQDPKNAAEEWRRAGAGFVLSAKAADLTPKASVTVGLLDLASKETLLERYYRHEASYWRSLAHFISDDITKQLTGQPGIAHTRITFVNDQTGYKEVYVVDYDGAGLKQLTYDRSITLLPRWNPDRKKIVYTSYKHRNPDLFELDLERGTSRTFLNRQGLNVAGGFSPDGSQIVVTLSMQKTPNIYLADLSDRSLKALTRHFGVESSPTFSPDGSQVAFVSDRSGNPQVHTLEIATGRIQRLTRLNWCDSPSWSPSGEWIAFAGRAHPKDPMDIFLVDVTGNQVRQLTHAEGTNEDPAWSPDGRFLVFTSTRKSRRELFVMGADGSAPRPVGDIPGNSLTPAWSL